MFLRNTATVMFGRILKEVFSLVISGFLMGINEPNIYSFIALTMVFKSVGTALFEGGVFHYLVQNGINAKLECLKANLFQMKILLALLPIMTFVAFYFISFKNDFVLVYSAVVMGTIFSALQTPYIASLTVLEKFTTITIVDLVSFVGGGLLVATLYYLEINPKVLVMVNLFFPALLGFSFLALGPLKYGNHVKLFSGREALNSTGTLIISSLLTRILSSLHYNLMPIYGYSSSSIAFVSRGEIFGSANSRLTIGSVLSVIYPRLSKQSLDRTKKIRYTILVFVLLLITALAQIVLVHYIFSSFDLGVWQELNIYINYWILYSSCAAFYNYSITLKLSEKQNSLVAKFELGSRLLFLIILVISRSIEITIIAGGGIYLANALLLLRKEKKR